MTKAEALKVKLETIQDIGDNQIEALATAMLDLLEILDEKEVIGFTK